MDKGMTASAQYSLKCYGEDGKAAEQWKTLQESVVSTIRRFVSISATGNFPVFSSDEHCTSYCNFATFAASRKFAAWEAMDVDARLAF